jgi:hypothetical protein
MLAAAPRVIGQPAVWRRSLGPRLSVVLINRKPPISAEGDKLSDPLFALTEEELAGAPLLALLHDPPVRLERSGLELVHYGVFLGDIRQGLLQGGRELPCIVGGDPLPVIEGIYTVPGVATPTRDGQIFWQMSDVAFVFRIPHLVRALKSQSLGDLTGGLEMRNSSIQAIYLQSLVLDAERWELRPCRHPAVLLSQL